MALSRLRILVFPETHRAWTARALEHDLAANGRTPEAALDSLLKITRAHIAYDLRHGREPLSAFAAAPQLYWNAFARATRLTIPLELAWRDSGAATPVLAATVPEHPILHRITPPQRVRIA
jgi:hypothetical protein